ncbi:hypothetical protein V8C37DRAFT_389157 [Trichoderma ceciliae]
MMKRRLLLPLSNPANYRKGGGGGGRQGLRLFGIRAVHVINSPLLLSVSSLNGSQTKQGKLTE